MKCIGIEIPDGSYLFLDRKMHWRYRRPDADGESSRALFQVPNADA